ncbi:MAG TPA: hypothetical protein VG754_06405 [Verrucomicrobiae bacterium]|nr:hypothetical protein [Verrucomicrobiae bacterium]
MNSKSERVQSSVTASSKAIIIFLLILAAALRIWNLPALNEVRDWDEIGYTTDGLMAWEGLLPGWESVPAGPQTWESWLFVGARSGWEFLHSQRKAATPGALKPLMAIDQALFKTYEDLGPLRRLLLWISIVISLAGVYGAYRLGAKYGGVAGGLLMGGLAAVLPLYLEYAGVAKSCSDAWMFSILAVSCAATMTGAKRCWWAGTMLGLAIGSRVDMAATVPLVFWGLWESHEKDSLWKSMAGTIALAMAIALLSAPFAMQGFVGILRQIVLSGSGTYWGAEPQRLRTLKELAWDQGLGLIFIIAVVGLFFLPYGTRLKRGTLAAFAALVVVSIFARHHQPVRYYGAQIIVILVFIAVGAGALFRRWPKPALAFAMLLLIFPLVQSIRAAIAMKAIHVPETSTEWVDAHVPAGTTVYVHPAFISRAVLPTEEAADAIWDIVTGNQAWRTKVLDGFHRFAIPDRQLPRALSEDNLCKDRGVCRRWFILGGGQSNRPRYNLQLVPMSATFGLQRETLGPEFQRTGGVVIWPTRASGLPGGLGEPFIKWVNYNGDGILVFVSPDVREKLTH